MLPASGSYGGKSGFGSEGVVATAVVGESGVGESISVEWGTSGSATAVGKAREACAIEGIGASGERRVTLVGAAEIVEGCRSSEGIGLSRGLALSRELATVLILAAEALRAYVEEPRALVVEFAFAFDPFDEFPRFDVVGTCRGRIELVDPVGESARLRVREGRPCVSDCCCELYE